VFVCQSGWHTQCPVNVYGAPMLSRHFEEILSLAIKVCASLPNSHFKRKISFVHWLKQIQSAKSTIPEKKSIDCVGSFCVFKALSRHQRPPWKITFMWGSHHHLPLITAAWVFPQVSLQENTLPLQQMQINASQTMNEIYIPEVLKGKQR